MEKHSQKNGKNKILKSIEFVFKQAKAGSKVHIAILIGTAVAAVLCGALIAGAISGGERQDDDDYVETQMDKEYDKDADALDEADLESTILPETPKADKEYIDNTLFIGDSNTVRTMLYGYTTWDNVIAAVSMGVQHITSLKMTYFKGMANPVTVPEAVKIIQPQRIIITYGTNNLTSYTPENFVKEYKKGIDAIVEAYPYADIIINSIPPLDKQRENTRLTMQQVDGYNKALAEFAKEEGYKFLNSAEALKDEKTGFAKTDYTIGDGVHLSMKGMEALFDYICTHAYETEDRRPKPLKKVPRREETPTGIIGEDPIAVRGSRVRILFQSSDTELGGVSGEVEQKIKRTVKSQPVTAAANLENGGIFKGWSCSVEGLSSADADTVTFTVPKVDESVTDIIITAYFERAQVSLNHGSLSLKTGETKPLSASVTERFKGNKTVTWVSENPKVATVDEHGNVKAVAQGSTTITASILEGKISASCAVSVGQNIEGIEITGNAEIKEGETLQLSARYKPAGTAVSGATWVSGNSGVAMVNENGLVTAVAEGSANITCTVGDYSATVTVKVNKKAEATPSPSPSTEPTQPPASSQEPTQQPTQEPTPTPPTESVDPIEPTPTTPAETTEPTAQPPQEDTPNPTPTETTPAVEPNVPDTPQPSEENTEPTVENPPADVQP